MLPPNPDRDAVAALLLRCRRALIFSHLNPDGDAIGSSLGLMWGLRVLGKEARVSIADPVPFNYRFVPGAGEITPRAPTDEDLIVLVDGSDPERFGPDFRVETVGDLPTAVIDHHITNNFFGTVNWVDPSYPACAQMIYELLQALDVPITPQIATCLLKGIATDTIGFSTDHTTPEIVQAASELMRAGGSLPLILKQAYSTRTLADVRLWGRILLTLQVDGHLAWAENRREDRDAVGATQADGEGITNFIRTIEGVAVAALFIERAEGGTKVSLRSDRGWDVAAVAQQLGGGGHVQAAGVTLNLPLKQAEVLVLGHLRRMPGPQG
ncbi:MAG TPA: bifunctional oligoribonuclease/PAP phosphatase NrnA [Ardenticatenaceae bacterium]|nr:bifunctional oligoribonuclease/PAP phosphatase NrnA [Ardenticatenaceae bacterium]